MKAAFLIYIFNALLCVICVVGVIYSPFEKVASMWVAGGIYVMVGVLGTILIGRRFER